MRYRHVKKAVILYGKTPWSSWNVMFTCFKCNLILLKTALSSRYVILKRSKAFLLFWNIALSSSSKCSIILLKPALSARNVLLTCSKVVLCQNTALSFWNVILTCSICPIMWKHFNYLLKITCWKWTKAVQNNFIFSKCVIDLFKCSPI